MSTKNNNSNNNTKTVGNISAIREQSEEYDHDLDYQYSSSFMGSTLQDNLRQVANNTELSDF